ncbi:hypothetical protein BUALT_Bualt07G0087600 [Buddleja alternifolia]|uniref:DET1- and DDB1-associated protein 1 n=1 Tax=Buddleja alternifolia TaxID=168488 RepID=A0AAV6XDQ1_9LAMI|nr:hypothetical protein BUALT_Bualt07G0087600 [Buddleja alternifolia]
MEGGCSASPPSEASGVTVDSGSGGASKFLANLPSRGLFSSTVLSSNPGGMRVYICDHDTSPPDLNRYSVVSEDQLIKTNQTNILIRSLMLKNQKGDSSSRDGKVSVANQGSRKRAAEKALDKAAGKKAMSSTQLGSSQEGSSRVLDKDLDSLKVEKLRALLKERGLSTKGIKANRVGCPFERSKWVERLVKLREASTL